MEGKRLSWKKGLGFISSSEVILIEFYFGFSLIAITAS